MSNESEEPIIDPERPIIDPHHHLWRGSRLGGEYLLQELHGDTGSGHNIVKTVFVECGAEYRQGGPEHLRPLGETEFVVDQAKQSEQTGGAVIAGIVGRADLRSGDSVREVLEAHLELGDGRFRGIRHAGARDPHPEALMIAGRAPEGLYADPGYRRGMNVLGEMGLTFDTWHYHHQNADFAALARACPNTRMILDHFGTPLGVGPYADRREEIFEQWRKDIAEIAACDNVVAKIGGMAMPDNGFGWHERDVAVSSDEFVEAQSRYYLHAIECFGVDRCLMESNFPVDKMSIAYPVLYNGLKKIVSDFSDTEKHALFYGNAERVYRLD